MRSHGTPIEKVHRPINRSLLLQRLQDALPHAGLLPAVKATGDGAPGTKAFREIAPGRAGFQQPHNGIQNGSMVFGRPTRGGALGRQEGGDLRPLFVCQFMSSHTSVYHLFANTP